jgi:hypothetical protein
MRGRWAAGIIPRNFAWIIKSHLAVSERPGGSAPDHRRVRRQEEILWLRAQGFTRVVSLLASSHNLHAYEEFGLDYAHVPMGVHADFVTVLGELYPKLLGWLRAGDRILVHQDELGERVAGVCAGFLCWSGMIPELPLAISAVEQLLRRQLGSAGRTIAALAAEVPPPAEEERRPPVSAPGEVIVNLPREGREAVAAPVEAARQLPPAVEARPTAADVATEATEATVADLSLRRRTAAAQRLAARPAEAGSTDPAEPRPPEPSCKLAKPRPTPRTARTPAAPPAAHLVGTAAAKPAPQPAKAPARRPSKTPGRASGSKPAGAPAGKTARVERKADGAAGPATTRRQAGPR